MIILSDVPFEKRARFLYDSICAYPDSPAFDEALRGYAGEMSGIDIAGGLKAFHDLLRQIYADVACVEGKGDQGKYLELVATMWFLYAAFAYGELAYDRDQCSILIDKTLLGQHYKKGGYSKRQRHLALHGFSIKYLSEQGECESLSRALQLSLASSGHPSLIPAARYFAASIVSVQEGKQKIQYNKLAMFLKGDYEATILREPIPRDAFDPLRRDLLDTIDAYREDWLDLVDKLRHQCGLECSGFWTYGGTPAWGVSFAAKGKRPLAIFTLGPNIVFIEFTLPLNAAERIIRERRSYSNAIREQIEAFHCVKCPKACKGSNLTKVDDVWLCSGRAEARRIYTILSSSEDFASLNAMIDVIC